MSLIYAGGIPVISDAGLGRIDHRPGDDARSGCCTRTLHDRFAHEQSDAADAARRAMLAFAVGLAATGQASAACPGARHICRHRRRGGDRFQCRPGMPPRSANTFKMVLDNNVVLDGVVCGRRRRAAAWHAHAQMPRGRRHGRGACRLHGVAGRHLHGGRVRQRCTLAWRRARLRRRSLSSRTSARRCGCLPAHGGDGFSNVPWDVFHLKGARNERRRESSCWSPAAAAALARPSAGSAPRGLSRRGQLRRQRRAPPMRWSPRSRALSARRFAVRAMSATRPRSWRCSRRSTRGSAGLMRWSTMPALSTAEPGSTR